MNIINVTIRCAGVEEFPRCSDLLESCPAVSIIAQPVSMSEAGAWMALGRSDILILDEAALEQDGLVSVQGLLARLPTTRVLLVIDKYNKKQYIISTFTGD